MTDIDHALEAHRREKEVSPTSDEELPRFREEEEFRLAPVETAENLEVASVLAHAAASIEPISPTSKVHVNSSTQKSRQLLLIAMLGIGGLFVSVGLFYMFMQYARSGSKKQDSLNQTVATVSGKEVDSDEQKESGQDNPSGTPTVSDVEDEKVPIESPSGAATDIASNNVDPNGSVASDPDASNLASDASKAEVRPVKEGNDVANTISIPEEKGTALAESPDKTPGALVAGSGAKGSGLGGQNDIPEEMKRFLKGGILGGPLLSDAALQEDEVDVPTLPEVIEIGELIHPGLAPLPKSGALDMAIQKLKIADRSLFDLVHWLSSLSSVGIGVDYHSLVAAGFDRDQKLQAEFDAKPLKEMLDELASSLDLQVDVVDGGLVILRATDAVIERKLPTDWSFADLTTPDTLDVWGRFLVDVMPDESELWTIENGTIVWQPTATPMQKFRTAIALDRMRVACKLAPKGGYRAQDLAEGLGFESTVQRLNATGTRVIIQEQPILQTMQQIANEGQFKLIADWPNLWKHGFTPNLNRLTIQRNRTIEQVFGYFLDRYALELTIVDEGLLRVTIPEVRRLDHQLRVVPITATRSLEFWTEKLRTLSPTDENRVSRFLVAPLPGKSYAVVRICAPTIAQVKTIMGSGVD